MQLQLAEFDNGHAAVIAGWPADVSESEAWAGADAPFPLSPDMFVQWHADADVHPFVCVADDELIGYGEIWVDAAEREMELARIIISPSYRGRGLGQPFVRLLLKRAETFGFSDVFLRVLPDNHIAIGCYVRTGFVRVSAEDEQRFNQSQPRPYVWMRQVLNRPASETS